MIFVDRESKTSFRQTVLTDGGSKLGSFKIDQKEYEFPIMCIMRDDLQDPLRKYIANHGGKIEYGKKLEGVEDMEDKVIAHFADGSSAVGDILIGADGTLSPLSLCGLFDMV